MTIAVDLGRKATKLRILVAGLRDNIIDNRWIEYDHNFILLHVIQHRPQVFFLFLSQNILMGTQNETYVTNN